jgi:hypothetical protein
MIIFLNRNDVHEMVTYTRQIKIAGRNHIRWKLHAKLKIDNSKEGIKIEC